MLSHAAQIAPLRRLAIRALESYPVVDPTLRFVTHGENTTFMVDASIAVDGSRNAPLERVDFSCGSIDPGGTGAMSIR